MSDTTSWFDHKGNLMTAPASEEPTGFGLDRYTHRLMKPSAGQVIQAVSWCGRRILEVPGRGEVDCPECVALLAEDTEGAGA